VDEDAHGRHDVNLGVWVRARDDGGRGGVLRGEEEEVEVLVVTLLLLCLLLATRGELL
jgi:hypothetical protein